MTDKEILKEIANIMERWNHGRDNDNETTEKINKLLKDNGYLTWFKY